MVCKITKHVEMFIPPEQNFPEKFSEDPTLKGRVECEPFFFPLLCMEQRHATLSITMNAILLHAYHYCRTQPYKIKVEFL
jgi:hypothetical protein